MVSGENFPKKTNPMIGTYEFYDFPYNVVKTMP
jgi:hypothetical protein